MQTKDMCEVTKVHEDIVFSVKKQIPDVSEGCSNF